MSGFYENLVGAVNRVSEPLTKRPFWRVDAPVVRRSFDGRIKVVKGGLLPSQREWWEAEARVRVIVGGFGSGKTMTLCKRMIALALENAPIPVATVSPAYTMAAKTVVPMFKELLGGKQSLYGRSFWWRYVQNPTPMFEIRYRGRFATIWVLSSDNPMSLRGTNLAAAGIDEPFIQDILVYKEMIGRVRHPGAVKREICLAGTPEELNWGYDLCIGELGENTSLAVVNISTRENHTLPPEYIQDLRASYTAEALEAYLDGKFRNLSQGQVYYGFDPMQHVVDLPCPKYGVNHGAGMDFNVNPMAALPFWRAGSHMHIYDEIELPNADTVSMAIELRHRYPQLNDIFPDPSGKARKTSANGQTDFSILKRYGFTINAPNAAPLVRDRENTVNGKMRPASGEITFTISPKCKKLIKYLSVYTHTLKNTKAQKAMSHLIDALGYPICRLFPLARSGVRELRY